MKSGIVIALLVTFLCCPCASAEDDSYFFDLSLGAKYRQTPSSKQVLDASTGVTAGTDGQISYKGGTLSAGKELRGNAFLPSIFGNRPSLRIDLGFYTSDMVKYDTVHYDVTANQWLNVDGTIDTGTDFVDAYYTPKYESHQFEAGIMISGDRDVSSLFIPEAGIILKTLDDYYTLRGYYPAFGTYRLVEQHNLLSTAVGVRVGGKIVPYENGDFSFSIAPSVEALVAFTNLTARQDPHNETGGMETLTVHDNETHLILTPSVSADITYKWGRANVGLGLFAAYEYGAPYMKLQSQSGSPTKIDTSSETYELGGMLKLDFPF